MFSIIGQYTSKFCEHHLMELFLKKACKNPRDLFYKNITAVNSTIRRDKRNIPFCLATEPPSKEILNPNVIQNAIIRLKYISEAIRKKISVQNFFCNKNNNNSNNNNNSPITNVVNQHHTITSRLHGPFGLGDKSPIKSSLFTSSNIRRTVYTLVRSFATSSVYSQNNIASKFDFPILPLPSKSKSALRSRNVTLKPIVQSYMPLITKTDTRNQSEKVYQRIRNSCKSLVADLMYSFPFNTQIVDRTKESTVPKFNMEETQKNSTNLKNQDKLSAKPRNSIWSIADNFSFPNINRRFDIESLVKAKDNDTDEILATNSTLPHI